MGKRPAVRQEDGSGELQAFDPYMLSPTDSIAGTKYIGMAVDHIQTVKNFTRGHRKCV